MDWTWSWLARRKKTGEKNQWNDWRRAAVTFIRGSLVRNQCALVITHARGFFFTKCFICVDIFFIFWSIIGIALCNNFHGSPVSGHSTLYYCSCAMMPLWCWSVQSDSDSLEVASTFSSLSFRSSSTQSIPPNAADLTLCFIAFYKKGLFFSFPITNDALFDLPHVCRGIKQQGEQRIQNQQCNRALYDIVKGRFPVLSVSAHTFWPTEWEKGANEGRSSVLGGSLTGQEAHIIAKKTKLK